MKQDKNKRVLLVGGGTGGHAIPVLELYQKLEEDGKVSPLIIGSNSSVDREIFSKIKNYQVIITGKLHRRFTLMNIWEGVKFIVGMIQSYFYLTKYKPDLIFSKGGYVSVPVLKMAQIFQIPVMIHESDTEMGMANKLASNIAKKIFVGFSCDNYNHLPKEKLIYSGQILRRKLFEKNQGELSNFGFVEKKPTILLTGGSQGSHNLNISLFQSLPDLLKSYNVIHQTGKDDFSQAFTLKEQLSLDEKRRYYITEFLELEKNSIMDALRISDLVVGRAGANSIAEFALMGKAMILIPYQYAAGDHQSKNAEVMKENRAAVVIPDAKLSRRVLTEAIKKVIDNKTKRNMLSRNAKDLFPKNGLNLIIRHIYKELDLT